MLYWLTAAFGRRRLFNLFRYITFRAGGAFITALVLGSSLATADQRAAPHAGQRPADP